MATADALRREVIVTLAGRHAPVIVDMIFTTVEEFAAPTTGFAADQATRLAQRAATCPSPARG